MLLDVSRECCIPSLLDTVLTEALGLQKQVLQCNNEDCRRVILAQGTVAREFGHFKKSNGEAINNQAQHALWAKSGEDKCMENLIKHASLPWESIEKLQVRILKGFNAIEAVREQSSNMLKKHIL